MIYEVRTYNLKPHSLPEVEMRFGEAYEKRKEYSELAAIWRTEIGSLNQIIHVWPYKDLEERNRIRATSAKGGGGWPPKFAEFVTTQFSDIMMPFAFSPELKPGKIGPYFEMRTDTYASGELPKLTKVWEKALPVRQKFGPVYAVWYSELGGLNKFVHVYPYPTLDALSETRAKERASGMWPASMVAKKEGLPDYQLLSQESKILMPLAFSPLQ
ncbi:MAG: NIPSNAP family protein [candidate division NC10 bacterium]|nr:NIPSNAP family protein [candidate division NC10 bacterium]